MAHVGEERVLRAGDLLHFFFLRFRGLLFLLVGPALYF